MGAVCFVWDFDGLVSNALLILFLIVLAGIATIVSVVFSLRSFSIGLVSLGPVRFSMPRRNVWDWLTQSVSDAGYGGPHRSKAPAVPGDPLSGLEVGGHSHSKEGGYLSELMASCVATLLMIQTCTDRALPHSDVVLTLDSAIASLKPHAQVGKPRAPSRG